MRRVGEANAEPIRRRERARAMEGADTHLTGIQRMPPYNAPRFQLAQNWAETALAHDWAENACVPAWRNW